MSITISDTEPRVQYTASSGQTVFSVGFEFFNNSDLVVIKTSSGTDTTLTYSATPSGATQYSVVGAGVSGGGSITLGGGATLNDIYTIYRNLPVARTTDFSASGSFPVETLNTELDKVIAMTQQIERDLKFSPRAAATTSTAYNLTFPELVANKILSVNSAGNAVEFDQTTTDVATVAGISADITTVSGIAANVTTVAGIAANVTSVAGDATDIGAVAAKATEIGLLGTSAAVADLAILGTTDVVADMNTLGTSDVVTDMNTLATSDVVADMNTLATSAIVTDMDLLATSANVTAMGLLGNSTSVTNMGLLGVSGVITDMNLLGTSAVVADMALLATSDVISDMNDLATSDIISDLNTLATSDIVTDMNLLATSGNVANMATLGASGVVTNIATVAGISGNITTVAGISSNVTTVAGISGNVTTVAGISANVTTVAGISANVTTVATNLAAVNNFADVYRIASSAPSSSLTAGDLYFNTSTDILNVYGSSGWQNAGSSVNGTSQRYKYIATSSQTTFTGSDANSNTLAYDAGYLDVYLNGVHLDPSDYTASSGTSVVLGSGAATGDILYIVGFGTFSVASINADNLSSGTIPVARYGVTVDGVDWESKSANFTAAAGKSYFCDTTSNAIDVTLPSPTIGDTVRFLDVSGTFDTNDLTILYGSSKIQGASANLDVATERAGFALVYYNSTQGWLLKDK